MKKNQNNEELQSRREFFKNAAKGAMPIIGAIVLAGAPQIIKAAESAPMGCNTGCYGSCYTGCMTTCLGGCNTSCNGMCMNNCYITCSGSCRGACGHSSY